MFIHAGRGVALDDVSGPLELCNSKTKRDRALTPCCACPNVIIPIILHPLYSPVNASEADLSNFQNVYPRDKINFLKF